MRKDGTKGYTIRIDEQLLHKLHVISAYEGRSANSQVLILIRDAVEHGRNELEGKKIP